MTGGTKILVPLELFAPAESSSFEGILDMPVIKAGPDLYDFAEPLSWSVDVTNTGEALLVSGTVEGDAKTSCVRCLETFEIPITGEIEGYFLLPGVEGEPSEDMDMAEDEFDVLGSDNVIDLEPLIRAAVLLDIPLVPLCRDDCKGLCSTCGANLNEGPCGCAATDGEDFAEQANPFSALKDISFENGEAPEGKSTD